MNSDKPEVPYPWKSCCEEFFVSVLDCYVVGHSLLTYRIGNIL